MTEATMKQVELQDGASADIVQENVQHLKELFPDAFTENGVDFDTLRQLLGDLKVLDEGEEKYGLNWHGKKQARQIALTPSLGTLLPCPEESVDWDTTQNLFIEGDNLEVLKLLQKSYANKVKMIYIDPPYNTGKEFVYPDKFQDNLDTYLKYTGQKGDEGLKFTSNTETGGRKHTNWLNMMYPRLKLAKSLLTQDGVIFISIDDNEQANLKEVCDEIFGAENFIELFIWRKKSGGGQQDDYVVTEHDYIMCYARNKEEFKLNEKTAASKTAGYNFYDEVKNRKYKRVKLAKWGSAALREDRLTMYEYPELVNPDGEQCLPVAPDGRPGRWRYGRQRVIEMLKNDDIDWENSSGDWLPYEKDYEPGEDDFSILKERSIFYDLVENGEGANELTNLFGIKDVFSNPKPTDLIAHLIYLSLNPEEDQIVMDFFAGSGSTGSALYNFNKLTGSNSKYVLVQLPEKIEKDKKEQRTAYNFCKENNLLENISEISKERIRRAAKKIKDENPDYAGDLGFKVFKLASSNIKAWNPDRTDLEGSMLDHKEHLVEGRSEQDILYELLLKRGVDLTTPIETKQIAGKNVYSIGYGKIITCLDDLIAGDDVEPLAAGIVEWQKELKDTLGVKVLETHVFFKDSAFRDDVAKTNMAAILSQHGIDHVRSL